MLALQKMLAQETPTGIQVSAAWPDDWSVNYRLHMTGGRVVEG